MFYNNISSFNVIEHLDNNKRNYSNLIYVINMDDKDVFSKEFDNYKVKFDSDEFEIVLTDYADIPLEDKYIKNFSLFLRQY